MNHEPNHRRVPAVQCPHARAVMMRTRGTEWGAIAMILLGVAFLIVGIVVGSAR